MTDTILEGSVLSDSLSHFGIKGMKWGKHKAALADSISTTKADLVGKAKLEAKNKLVRPVTADAKMANDSRKMAKKHGTDSLSNAELKSLVTRMNLEQQYATLKEKPSMGRSGRKYVAETLAGVGQTLLTDLLTSGIKRGAGAAAGYAYSSYERRSSGPGQITRNMRAIGR